MSRPMDDRPFPPRTSLPDWSATDLGLDQTARSYTVIVLGREPSGIADRWGQSLEQAGIPHDRCDLSADGLPRWVADDAEPWFERLLARHRVGWRAAVCGEEIGVLRMLGLARLAGLLQSEVRGIATDRERSFVYCPHCTARTLRPHPTPTVVCSGCGRELEVHPHISHTLDCYLASDRAARDRRRVRAAASPEPAQPR